MTAKQTTQWLKQEAAVPLPELRDAALSLRAGGVGYYPDSQFVHLDTGRVRSW